MTFIITFEIIFYFYYIINKEYDIFDNLASGISILIKDAYKINLFEVNSLENKPTANDNKCNFKLYRKKPINSVNNIYNTMNLTMDS